MCNEKYIKGVLILYNSILSPIHVFFTKIGTAHAWCSVETLIVPHLPFSYSVLWLSTFPHIFETIWYCACVVLRGHLVHTTWTFTALGHKSEFTLRVFELKNGTAHAYWSVDTWFIPQGPSLVLVISLGFLQAGFSQLWYCACVVFRGYFTGTTRSRQYPCLNRGQFAVTFIAHSLYLRQ